MKKNSLLFLAFLLVFISCEDEFKEVSYSYKNMENSLLDEQKIKRRLRSISLGFFFLSKIEGLEPDSKKNLVKDVYEEMREKFSSLAFILDKSNAKFSSFAELYKDTQGLLQSQYRGVTTDNWKGLCALDDYLKRSFRVLVWEPLKEGDGRFILASLNESLDKMRSEACERCGFHADFSEYIEDSELLVDYLKKNQDHVYAVFYFIAYRIASDFSCNFINWAQTGQKKRLPRMRLEGNLADLIGWNILCEDACGFKIEREPKTCCSFKLNKSKAMQFASHIYRVSDLFLSLTSALSAKEIFFLELHLNEIPEEEKKELGLTEYEEEEDEEETEQQYDESETKRAFSSEQNYEGQGEYDSVHSEGYDPFSA